MDVIDADDMKAAAAAAGPGHIASVPEAPQPSEGLEKVVCQTIFDFLNSYHQNTVVPNTQSLRNACQLAYVQQNLQNAVMKARIDSLEAITNAMRCREARREVHIHGIPNLAGKKDIEQTLQYMLTGAQLSLINDVVDYQNHIN